MVETQTMTKQTMGLFLLLIVGVISFFIIKPLLISILSASIFAILFRPIYNKLNKYIRSKTLCASIISIVVILLVFLPIWFLGQAVFVETAGIVHDIASQNLSSEQVYSTVIAFAQRTIDIVPGVNQLDLKSMALDSLKDASNWARTQLFAIPSRLFFGIMSLFLFYYLLKDGDKFVQWIYDGLPISKKNQLHIDSQLKSITYFVVYGQIVTAIIQGLIAMLGYWLFGIHAPVLWGIATMFFSLVPVIGTAIIWIPASIFLFVNGLGIMGSGADGSWWLGIGLFVYGFLIIAGFVDYIVRPLLIGASSRIHPAIALIGVIGGVVPLGFIGIFAGPLILALFITLYDILIRKIAT